MDLFDFLDYKKYVRKRIESMPKKGYGQFRRMADHLRVNSVTISQVFNGDRQLSVEQACELIDFFGFSDLEGRYFVALVERERAGSHRLRKMVSERIEALRVRSQDLKQRLKQERELTEESKAAFYSNWYYSGIRLLTSIDGYQSVDAVAEYFRMPVATAKQVLDFLVAHGLCKEDRGRYQMGPSSTHLEATSPLIGRHHGNWRIKALSHMDQIAPEELFLTLPCSLSKKAMHDIRKELVRSIDKIVATVDAAPCETLACLNIDFFKF